GRSAAPAGPTGANATAAVPMRSLVMGRPPGPFGSEAQPIPDPVARYPELWATRRINRYPVRGCVHVMAGATGFAHASYYVPKPAQIATIGPTSCPYSP